MRRGKRVRGADDAANKSRIPEPVYKFPQLTAYEVVNDLRLFEYTLSEEAVKNPTPDSVRNVFIFFLNEIYGAKRVKVMLTPSSESASRSNAEASADGDGDAMKDVDVPYKEIYTQGIGQYHLLRAFDTMLQEARYPMLYLKDLTLPSGRRHRLQLSALLNLAKYRRARAIRWDEVCATEDATETRHANLRERLAGLDETLKRERQAIVDQQPQVEEEKLKVAELNERLRKLKAERAALIDAAGADKSQFVESARQAQNLVDITQRMRGEVASNKQLIVQSPRRVLNEFADDENRLYNIKDAIADATAQIEQYVTRGKSLLDAIPNIRICDALAEKCAERIQYLADERLKLADVQTREFQARTQLEQLEREQDLLARTIQAIVARRQRSIDTRNENNPDVEDDRNWERVLANVAQFEEQCDAKIDEYHDRLARLAADLHTNARNAADDLPRAEETHALLLDAVKNHAQQIRSVMALFQTDSAKAIEQLTKLS